MYKNSLNNTENQEKSIESTLFFDSNPTPFISLIEHLFNQDNKLELLENIETSSTNILEARNAKFINTNKNFVFMISKQENDWLIHFQLPDIETLTEEEKDICKYYMKKLNSMGFCFYIDNEFDTFNFDEEMYGIKTKTSSTTIRNEKFKQINLAEEDAKETSNSDIWKTISNRMKELKMPIKLMNRIRVQRWHLMNKYGDDYVNYIGEYAEQQFNDFINSKN